MPILENARHEKFAQAIARGLTATEAYCQAGYKGDRTSASRLSTNDNIRQRVQEIQGRVAEKAEWSAAERLSALKGIFEATHDVDPRVAISAIAEANKMQGSHAAVRHQIGGDSDNPLSIVFTTIYEQEPQGK